MTPPIICSAGYADELRAAGYEPVVAAMCSPATFDAGAVIVLDELTPGEVAQFEGLLAASGRTSVAVLVRRWDGFEPLPLANSCRGIISGFGVAGIAAAVRELTPQG